MKTDRQAAQIIWDYMRVEHEPKKSDLILCLGSHDHSVADRAIQLYNAGLAPIIMFSGGFGFGTAHHFAKTEADTFADIARAAGVPSAAIIIENTSTNTGENIQFSCAILKTLHLSIKRIILVQKPFMERRTFATFKAQWPKPQPTFYVTSLPGDLATYCKKFTKLSENDIINVMVGDLQRIREYPKQGFQVKQDIPSVVWEAYEHLIARGYTKHTLK